LSRICTDGKPLPLTLVPAKAFTALAEAAHNGFVAIDGGRRLNGAEYLESLVAAPESVSGGEMVKAYFAAGAGAAVLGTVALAIPFVNLIAGAAYLAGGVAPRTFGGKIGVTLIVANGLKGALRQIDYLFMHGNQTAYPALVDPNDAQPPQNQCVVDGYSVLQGGESPLELYGIGCYRFEKDRSVAGMGVFGTSGAVALTSDDPATNGKTMAVSWRIPERLESGKPACGVTADLRGSYKSLQAFYEATAGAGSAASHEAHTPDWSIDSSLVLRESVPASKSKPDTEEHVLTVSVQEGRA
jgi:hypothetical protein